MSRYISTLKFIILIPILISFILPFQETPFCAERTPKTVITVLEGEVSCIDYPKWLLKEVALEELRSGILIRLESEDIAIVDIYVEDVRAYIPDIVKKEVGDKLVPDALVLIRKNIRRIQGTNWDIVAVGKRAKAGFMFRENVLKEVGLEEVISTLDIWEGMQKVSYEKVAEAVEPVAKAEITTTSARDLSFIDRELPEEEVVEEEFTEITFAPSGTVPTTGGLSITTSSTLTGGTEGSPYSQTLSASGGSSPYTWSLVSGSLPSGLSLGSDGIISGTPASNTASSTSYNFTIRVTDSDGDSVDMTFSLKISGYSDWTQVNTSGFGYVNNNMISSMALFGTDLYAGTSNPVDGCQIWRSSDGTTWACVVGVAPATAGSGFGPPDPVHNAAAVSIMAFGSYICVGTLHTEPPVPGGQLWFSSDGTTWIRNAQPGFGTPGNTLLRSMASFNGSFYVGTRNSAGGGEIRRSSDVTAINWTQANGSGWGDTDNDEIFSMAVFFGGYLYAGTENNAGAEIWRTNNAAPGAPGDWEEVVGDGAGGGNGFGPSANYRISSMMTFGNHIYAGTGNTTTGAQLWRSSNGTTWEQVIGDGFGDVNNREIISMVVFGGYIYAGTKNDSTGGEIWRSSDGTTWEQINTDGFGDVNNRDIPAIGVFGSYIYAGTLNDVTGGQIWRFAGEYIDPNITGRVYDSETGETLDNVIVTIYPKDSTTALATCTTNPYSFNVDTGYYYLRVEKEGYTFPSNNVNGITSGDHGEVFAASGSGMTIDIPIDEGYPLEITKTANKKQVVNGEIITYQIKIKNNSYWTLYNINIIDEITNGFKYISNSSYIDSTVQDDPEISNRRATFRLSSLEGHKSTYLTYQVRVGVGISPGRYKTKAVAWDRVRDWQMSNESSYTVEVIEDPLFTKGTIIGKVFWDLNGNGVQDQIRNPKSEIRNKSEIPNSKSETGIPGVEIYTEYGVCVETDEDGKYHIADVPPGQHLLKVDLPGSTFTTENPYYVKVTEGLLAKVNFGLKAEEKPVTRPTPRVGAPQKPEDKFFIVALGEGEVRNIDTSGNIEMASSGRDDRYDEGIKVDGRLALYLKGKVLGKYLITASLDTERRPGGKYDSRKLFTNLDPDKYYPVYGDASKVDYNGVDTQDILYVLIEWDESSAKWGSFHTGISLYERTMSGGIIEYKSIGKTKFEDDRTNIKVFGAFSRQKPAHDELVGTGGSLYYLRHRDVIEGSEKVKAEVRDRISRKTLGVIYLREEIDYEIDYDTGRLLLKRPLNSITQPYTGSIISNDILAGSSVYLVIDYEYYSSEGLSNQAEGIKGSQWIGNHIRVGGTYIEEQKPETSNQKPDNYKLMGGDATIKLSPKIQIDGSYHRTEETLLDNGMSYDGGITFTEQGEDYSNNRSGNAVNVSGTAGLFNNTDVYLEYSRQDPYYSISGSIANQGSQKYIADIIHRLTRNITLGVSHITQKHFEGTIGATIIGSTHTDTTSGIIDYRKGRWDIRTEYQHREVENPIETSIDTYFGTLPLLKNDFIGVRVGYELFKWLHPYIRGQLTINGPSNDQATVGSAIRLWDKGELDLSYTKGTIGDSALVGLTTRYGEDTDIFTNIETGNNLQLGRYIKTSYGETTNTKDGDKIYMVQDYSTYRERFVRGSILGYDKKINDIFTIGFTYERSHINDRRLDIDRDSGSVSLSYLDNDFLSGLKGFNKLEIRADRGNAESRQWLTQNDILLRVTEGLTLSGRCNWGWTEDRDNYSDFAEFYEVGAGFSLRPVAWDKLNILGKYSYIMDLGPEGQADFSQITKALRNVYALEGIYDLCKYLSLVGKYAYRAMSEAVGPRDWVDSDTYLYLGRVNFHITKKWDIATEYRVLSNEQIEDTKSGWLLEVDREITEYIRFGVGYNFTDYDDDLRDEDNWDAKGWFVRVSGKY